MRSDDGDPFRCQCGANSEYRCLLRATQEDMLCDDCRERGGGSECVILRFGPQVSKSGEWEYIGHAGPVVWEPIPFGISEQPSAPSLSL